jgi:hypothetical protein
VHALLHCQRGRQLVGDLDDERLHRLRLAGWRVRRWRRLAR